MANTTTLTGDVKNTIGVDPHIEHHNRTLPLTPEELAKYMPHPSLAEHFKEMQKRLLALAVSNKEL